MVLYTCIYYILDVIQKKKQEFPRKQPGELVLEECPTHYSIEEWDKYFAKMQQQIWCAKISLSDKKEM